MNLPIIKFIQRYLPTLSRSSEIYICYLAIPIIMQIRITPMMMCATYQHYPATAPRHQLWPSVQIMLRRGAEVGVRPLSASAGRGGPRALPRVAATSRPWASCGDVDGVICQPTTLAELCCWLRAARRGKPPWGHHVEGVFEFTTRAPSGRQCFCAHRPCGRRSANAAARTDAPDAQRGRVAAAHDGQIRTRA